MLIIFSGLPGVGKTTLSKELARQISATYIRIDTIEQAIKNSSLNINDIIDVGYIVGYRLAEDNLKIGKIVIADSVNSLKITRDAWLDVAKKIGVKAIEIEVICSDALEHRHRVETRKSDIIGHKMPNWQDVLDRNYEKWYREHLIIDTAKNSIDENIDRILKYIDYKKR